MRFYGLLGLLLLLISQYFLFRKVEPFYSWFYSFAWWSYILLADNLLLALRGRSLLTSQQGELRAALPGPGGQGADMEPLQAGAGVLDGQGQEESAARGPVGQGFLVHAGGERRASSLALASPAEAVRMSDLFLSCAARSMSSAAPVIRKTARARLMSVSMSVKPRRAIDTSGRDECRERASRAC